MPYKILPNPKHSFSHDADLWNYYFTAHINLLDVGVQIWPRKQRRSTCKYYIVLDQLLVVSTLCEIFFLVFKNLDRFLYCIVSRYSCTSEACCTIGCHGMVRFLLCSYVKTLSFLKIFFLFANVGVYYSLLKSADT